MSKRSEMLGSVVRELIAPELLQCPQECGMVSITDIEVSGDLSVVTVLLSALEKPELALQFFEGRHSELKKRLGALHRKRVPELRFVIDPRSERGARVDTLLNN